MNPKLRLILDDNHSVNSMFLSVVGTMVKIANTISDQRGKERDPDLRAKLEEAIGEIVCSVGPDRTSWTYVKTQMSYSEYLRVRTLAGTITEFDKIRPGLVEANFDKMEDYYEHYGRVLQAEKDMEAVGTTSGKPCSKCGAIKPETAFKRGAVCNSCRSKMYRQRKAEQTE